MSRRWAVFGCVALSACSVSAESGPEQDAPPRVGDAQVASCTGPFHGGPVHIVDIAAGSGTTCVIDSAGFAYCWGDNVYGQGLSPHAESELVRPTRSPWARCLTDMTLGPWFGCAHRYPDRAVCWGSNKFDDVSLVDPWAFGSRPREPFPLEGVVKVGVGAALITDGSVWVWGIASQYWWPEPAPQRVPNLAASTLPTSGTAYCAINERQRVACWGSNVSGQTGQRPKDTPQRAAEELISLGPAQEVGVNPGRACARLADGTVWCWGAEPLGHGEPGGSAAPVRVLGIEGAISLAVGGQHTCAVDGEGRVFCWGDNSGGQLGIAPFNHDVWEPLRIYGVPRAVQVAAGFAHACALTEAGEVYCWGLNTSGELGQGTSEGTSHIPVRVDIPLESP